MEYMPRITYAKTMYVETPVDIFDGIAHLLFVSSANISDDCLIATFSDIKHYTKEEPEELDIHEFLSEVVSKAKGKIGDVIFNKEEKEEEETE